MADKLPPWETVFRERSSYRIWKRTLRQTGKRLAFELIEPKIRELARKIRNRQHPAYDNGSLRPTERKQKMLDSLDEISQSRELVHSVEFVGNSDAYLCGVSGLTQYVLMAGFFLIEMMLADRKFERKLMGCLTMLAELDAAFVNDVGRQLQSPPT